MEVLLLNRKITDDEIFRIQVVKREDESANQGESIYEQLKREIRDELSDLRNIEDEELLRKEVATRYFGSSTKAILTAYHDALQRYKKVKAELIKER